MTRQHPGAARSDAGSSHARLPIEDIPAGWIPRPYQRRAWRALVHDGRQRVLLLWHRRAGKDAVLLAATAVAAMRRPGVYWHVFPTAKQGRKVIWDGVSSRGRRVTALWPETMVVQRNDADMKLRLANGSVWQVVGSDNFNEALIGANPVGIVFSEYALQNPACWDYMRPILAENGGWAAFAYTPRGANHGADLFEMASRNPGWFCERLTVDDTHAVPADAIEAERRAGMTDELIRQEFWCSFAAPNTGTYYARLIEEAHAAGRIGKVPPERFFPVETWWDLGIGDSTAIWFVQRVGGELRILDYYENSGEGLAHYAGVLEARGYRYHQHVFPHDVAVRELGTGRSRIETLRSLGVTGGEARAVIARNLPLADGINAVRTLLPHCNFDAVRCEAGLRALKAYQRKWDSNTRRFESRPQHDWASHAADAFRYGALMVRPGIGDTTPWWLQSDEPQFANGDYDPFA